MADDMDMNANGMDDFEDAPAANEPEDLDEEADYAPQKEGEEKDLIKDGGLKKLLLKEGEGWDKPEAGDDVEVHYTGTLLDGTKFDSSVDRNKPFTFKLGKGHVIRGWDKGVATMKKGEKALFTIAPDYAYGKQGSPPTIPPDSTLKFEVELLSWTSVKDICGDGALFKTVLVEGKKWETPKIDDEVLIKYEAKLSDGTVFAKSPEEGLEFYLKDGHLCEAMVKALKTMHKGEKSLLTVKPIYAFGQAGREAKDGSPAVPPNETLKIEVELVSWKTIEKITDDYKVMKKILHVGEGYERPEDEAQVKMRFVGMLADGTVFEKVGQEEGKEFEFVTDEEQVVDGLDKAVQKMKKGEKALVTISPEYGYKDAEHKGELAVVPPNSTLQYEVEVVSFVKDKQSWDLDTPQKLEAAAKKKEAGNALYKAGKFLRASKKYGKAVKFIEFDSSFTDEEKKQSKALQVTCNLNDAACKLKLKQYAEAVKLCSKVLETESTSVKALYRRTQGYIGTQDYDLAEWDIKKAMELDPENRDLKVEYKILKQKIVEQNKKEAKLFGNMFDRLRKIEEKENPAEQADGEVKEEPAPRTATEESEEPMVVEPAAAA